MASVWCKMTSCTNIMHSPGKLRWGHIVACQGDGPPDGFPPSLALMKQCMGDMLHIMFTCYQAYLPCFASSKQEDKSQRMMIHPGVFPTKSTNFTPSFFGLQEKGAFTHVVGWLLTALYYNDLGYVLAQVVSLVFCKQNTRLATCAKTYPKLL